MCSVLTSYRDMAESNHDDMLFNMLKDCKSLQVFFDEIFGFLYRRTDFYHISKNKRSALGLPNGVAELVVKDYFLKWKNINLPTIENNDLPIKESDIPAISEEIVTGVEIKPFKNLNISQKNKFNSSECYNGAVFGNYSWSQNINEIDIILKIPETTTAKELTVNVLPNKLTVKLRDLILLEGDLSQKCKHNDVIWSLSANRLEIHLEKANEIWWDCLLTSEPKLDLTKIDCSRPFEDLPDEAQAKIEELQWNQERKRLGLPTFDEMAQREILKKSWNVDGSPFSGPFDPSAVNFG